MSQVQITVTERRSTEDRDLIVRSLVGYNDSRAPAQSYHELVVLSHHGSELVGGLLGHTHWNWLFIKQLWVAEAFRSAGIGRSLMLGAEARRSAAVVTTHIATRSTSKRFHFTERSVTKSLGSLRIIPWATPDSSFTSAICMRPETPNQAMQTCG